MPNITVNAGLQRKDDTSDASPFVYRVLWFDVRLDIIVVINMKKESSLPEIWRHSETLRDINEKWEVVNIPPGTVPLEDHIPEKHKKKRNEIYSIIQPIVGREPDIYFPHGRRELILEVALNNGKSEMQIYTYLKRFWRGGKNVNSLLPRYDRCGRKGEKRNPKRKIGAKNKRSLSDPRLIGIPVTEEIRQIFRIAIEKWYFKRSEISFTKVYRNMIREFFSNGEMVKDGVSVEQPLPPNLRPTLRQFSYWFKQDGNLRKQLIGRHGLTEFNLNYRDVLGTVKDQSWGPGTQYQIDATIGDIYCVSAMDRKLIIGRPIIYAVVDTFSTMVAGIYVGLEGPNWIGAMMALLNAASSKVEYCKRFGISIRDEDWPCAYLPESIVGDRGEMISKNTHNLTNNLRVTVANPPPYRPDWKPIVESMFPVINKGTLGFCPGAVRTRRRRPGEKDHRLDGKLTLNEVEALIIKNVLRRNNTHVIKRYDERSGFSIPAEIPRIPIDLWNYGLAAGNGSLQSVSSEVLQFCELSRSSHSSQRIKAVDRLC